MNIKEIKELNIPKSPGCYRFKNKDGKIIYVGKAADLRSRVTSYWRESADHSPAKRAMMKEIVALDWIETDSEIEALLLEANLIKKIQPAFNVLLRDDKRFQYIAVTAGDEVPGVFATRVIGKSGKYYGPYTGGHAVRETLKALRKIWPYCTQKKLSRKPCFYAQIGRCTGVCGGQYPLKDYKEKVIRPIMLFLEGKKGEIIKNLELRIKNLEKEIKKCEVRRTKDEGRSAKCEEAAIELARTKYQLINMRSVLEHARILGIGEKYAADVIELAKVLGLKRVPERIEGYDISNIFGKEAVGSMVVFAGGEPDKNEYRKFKIRLETDRGVKAGDVQMLAEVLERRFKHLEAEVRSPKSEVRSPKPACVSSEFALRNSHFGKWPSPDLIIVDGGKAQLNAALRVLKRNELDIPLLAVSKGEGLRSSLAPDKIFFPGEKEPLVLPLASPALHIIKRVRDEAHRFAIGYHRVLRGKRWMK